MSQYLTKKGFSYNVIEFLSLQKSTANAQKERRKALNEYKQVYVYKYTFRISKLLLFV